MLILTNFEFFIPEIFFTVNLLFILLFSIVYVNKSGSGIYRYKESIKNISLINLTTTLLILIIMRVTDSISTTGSLVINN